jgi:hypothetical protein
MGMAHHQNHNTIRLDEAKFRETVALSRETINRSKSLIAEFKQARENSWKVIEESQINLDRANRLSKT